MIRRDMPQAVARWAAGKLGATFVPPYEAWGITDERGGLVGAVIFNDHSDRNIEMTFYGPRVNWAGLARTAARYCFGQLHCGRVTVRIRSDNRRARAMAERAGFVEEGVLRDWYGDGENAIIYGMTIKECRFLERKQ